MALLVRRLGAGSILILGTGVRLAQSILKDSGNPNWDPGAVDGDFGPQTELAVKKFQTDLVITPADGIVGEKTWTALWS
jgi:peptidoglycan hydrolase-like protein with peptidoglycan-binding domain